MVRVVLFLAIVVSVSLFSLTGAPAFGGNLTEPAVDKVAIINNLDDIQVSFEIRNAFTKEIEEGIKSGIPTTFTFFIELYRKRNLWFDEQLNSLTLRHTVKYDTLKEEYEIALEEKPQNTMRVKEIEQAKKIMAGGDAIIIKPVSALKKGEQYQIRIKATLDPVNLPFPLNYMLFFVSFWNYETAWYEKEFTP
ncbi:MAG: DUF4390 domain-containing protein [Deltaproteobacteria bacterium]|nr:DUF4390 domain-containing protein [Deltaproteobacteria bacterium]